MHAIELVCDTLDVEDRSGDKFIDNSIYETIADIAPAFNDTMAMCSWKRNELDSCAEIFKSIWSGEGKCFAFNALNAHEMYTERFVKSFLVIESI